MGTTTMINQANKQWTILGEKIFLDRYAKKDMDLSNTKVGDTVLVLTQEDNKYPVKEVGEVTELRGSEVEVRLRSGELIRTTLDKLTRPEETRPEQMWDRLAEAISSVEATPEKREEWRQKFRYILDDWKLVPGGRIAAGAGVSDELTLFNCYVIPSPKDSRHGIIKTLLDMTEIMARGGGVGINLSSLRPKNAVVYKIQGLSSGAVNWGSLYSFATGLIEQGGSRRGALMLMINDWHPDILDFITAKQKMGEITNANMSVCISNAFMKAVKEDLDWDLVFPDTTDPDYDELWDGDLNKWKAAGKKVVHYRTVRARDVWHTLIESAWKSAEPGVVFMERYNEMSNSWYFNPIVCTNPCGEQGLPPWGVCNLSAINLSKFYDAEKRDVAWDELRKTVRYSVRFLDNVIDKTPYHFKENEINQKNERRVGLGTMGLAELMIYMGIRYGSPESLEFLDKLYGFIAKEAYLASSEIAAEKGSFPKFEPDKFLQSGFMKLMTREFPEVGDAIRKQGIRNVTLITQAPTGSTGTMVDTSTGIEPFYAFTYYRRSRLGFDKQDVRVVQRWKEEHPGEELPDYFVTAMDLTAEEHIRVQAAIQKWVDSSISKTANCPADFTLEETKKLYELAYELGCKGVTIYRDGSRDSQVLHTEQKSEEEKEDGLSGEKTTNAGNSAGGAEVIDQKYRKRPQVLKGATYKINTPFGMAYITINDMNGVPTEIFLNVGKAGSDVFAMSEALGRVCSLFLRYGEHGNKARLLIKHLKGIGGSGAIGFGASRVESIADAVAKALEMHLGDTPAQENDAAHTYAPSHPAAFGLSSSHSDLCPSCGGATLIRSEGCKTCAQCGYSRC